MWMVRAKLAPVPCIGQHSSEKSILDRGAFVNALDIAEYTPLFYAAHQGNFEIARMLFERGAAIDVRVRDMVGTSLHWAARGGDVQLVQLLLDNGADVNAHNRYDETPSQFASGPKKQEVLNLLSEYGAK